VWGYATIEYYRQWALRTAYSLALILYAPGQLYSSLRPKTDMLIFRTPGAITTRDVESLQLATTEGKATIKSYEYHTFPVTRYAEGMSRGLYHGDISEDEEERVCGTYYYLERESRVWLACRTFRRYRNKYQAFVALITQVPDSQDRNDMIEFVENKLDGRSPYLRSWLHKDMTAEMKEMVRSLSDEGKFPEFIEYDLPADLMMTPLQAYHLMPTYFQGYMLTMVAALPQKKKYVGSWLGLYAAEDHIDRFICKLAQQLTIDVIILENMVGSHQVVTELVDTRPRMDSFDSLIYPTD
jgi:hypothetical protein